MKKLFSFLLFCFPGVSVLSQKPSIDFKAINEWPSLQYASISSDGKYVQYNETFDSRNLNSRSKLVIQSSETDWKYVIPGVNYSSFSSNSKYAIFLNSDTLNIVTLGADKVEQIPFVNSFLLQDNDKKEWLVYQLKNQERELVIKDLSSDEKRSYMDVDMYKFNANGDVLLLKTLSSADQQNVSIQWIDLKKNQKKNIWSGKNVKDIVWGNGDRLAFIGMVENSNKVTDTAIWYYGPSLQQAAIIADKNALAIDSSIYLDRLSRFSNDGTRLFLSYKEKEYPKPILNHNAVMVDVWSYTDGRLLSNQSKGFSERSYAAVLNIAEKAILRLEVQNDQFSMGNQQQETDVYGVVSVNSGGGFDERHWNTAAATDNYLVSTIDGSRRKLNSNNYYSFSAEGRYLVRFDGETHQYYAYNIASSTENCISTEIPAPLYTTLNIRHDPDAFGIAGWLPNDKSILLYDEFDIWKIDLNGNNPPVNITNGYGRKHGISLRLMLEPNRPKLVPENGIIHLLGFSYETKNNGFFVLYLGKEKDPKLLTFGPYVFYAPQNDDDDDNVRGSLPIKAKNANVYLVTRESATEYRNYFTTKDFKTFHPVSNYHPEQEYNWLTAELHSWKSLNGEALQGILYKPEDFDPNKKYPLIIHYYETKSNGLNAYKRPSFSNGAINIPYYVSNGYLVFIPDIHYKIGDPMQGTYDAVVSAANYLETLPFVNAAKLGIQGWSFGGFETNYLVTHTNIFAAAAETAGPSDLISFYGEIVRGGQSNQGFHEVGQIRMGGTLWDKPEMYIKNSAVFKADKVSTPLLMMNNKGDEAVPFAQGVELFLALRRLGKKVWLLQYDGQGHGVHGKAAEDFTTRLMQFFDHYLKDKPAPIWMTRGIPARLKGIETGLELDTETKTPPESGLLTPEEKRKVDALLYQ